MATTFAGKPLLTESRFGWRSGLNTALNADMLGADELVSAQNVRLGTAYGAISKRTGSMRLHAAALAGSVQGYAQWDAPAGREDVAIAGGSFYHRLQSAGETSAFTAVALAGLSTTATAHFVPFRTTSADAALVLYIACGGKLLTWDGTTLSDITGVSSAPQADRLIPYHTRLFARDQRYAKNLFWSSIGNGSDWAVVANDSTSGGNDVVDVLTGEAILAFGLVGSSLAIATQDSLVRFTGYASDDIRVAQDTEGISAEHGAVGPFALAGTEDWLAGLCSQGVYQITEGGVTPLSAKIQPTLRDLDRSSLSTACLAYHRGRRELWVAVEAAGDTGNQTVYVLDLALNAWSGPWSYPFAITCLARYQNSTGDEYIAAGCADGYIRHLDTGALDDVLSDGSGGSAYEMLAELAPIFFNTGPAQLKALLRAMVNVDAAATVTLQLQTAFDADAFSAETFAGDGEGTAVTRRVDIAESQGNRLRVRISDGSASSISIVHGLQLFAYDLQRMQGV